MSNYIGPWKYHLIHKVVKIHFRNFGLGSMSRHKSYLWLFTTKNSRRPINSICNGITLRFHLESQTLGSPLRGKQFVDVKMKSLQFVKFLSSIGPDVPWTKNIQDFTLVNSVVMEETIRTKTFYYFSSTWVTYVISLYYEKQISFVFLMTLIPLSLY